MNIAERVQRAQDGARAVKAAITETSAHLSDESAVSLPSGILPQWSNLIGQTLEKGGYIRA